MEKFIINPLLNRDTLPSFSKIKHDHITSAVDTIITENKQAINQIELNSADPSWENFVVPLEIIDEKLSRVWSQIGHLNSVVNSEELRKEYNKNLGKISLYYSELAQNLKIFTGFKNLTLKKNYSKLSVIQKKIVNDELVGFKLGGIDLSTKKQNTFKEIKSTLSKLSAKFEENLLDSVNAFNLHITSKDILSGLPTNILKSAQLKANENKKKGWLFTLDFPTYIPLMQYADNRQLRQDMYYAYATKASELSNKKLDNTSHINEILKLKLQLANILGFDDYASMSLTTKMAKSSDQIIQFLNNLARKAKPFATKDMHDLEEIGARYNINKIEAWDIAYLSEKIKIEKFNFSDLDIKNYFPKPKVLNGLFNLVRRLYGITITRAKTDVWHKDVEFYEIHNQRHKLIGQFYLDLYARKNKRGGAWMDEAISKFNFNGFESIPAAYLTCNFSSPSRGRPAYFTHDEVITLFHEFGHGLHHLLTDITHYSVAGIKSVEWDAVELPSQFMENFCWEWSVIKDMTEHVDTKKTMPKILFNKMIEAKNFQSGLQTLRQVEFALFDITLHSSYKPASGKFLAHLEKIRASIAIVKPPNWNRFPHSFSHIFAGGYAAGYYSYKWAEVLSADAYSLFEETGIFSKKIGNKFKNEILGRGGSRPAIKSFEAFRGRKPKIDALLKHSGLTSR
ncbi:M3 family metallopeptidase [Methylophilaceae bacterium]|nr:M3 family metallopeptidase [Methylophilaceae bacterium]